jgi:hypothetical protein
VSAEQRGLDVDLLKTWVADVAGELGGAMDAVALHGERLDHLLGLLRSLSVTSSDLVRLLPDNVATSRRKLLGPGQPPGWLAGRVLDRTGGSFSPPSKPHHVPSPPVTPAELFGAAKRALPGATQRSVLDVILNLALDGDRGDAPITPTDIAQHLADTGAPVHPETARTCLNRLAEIGAFTRNRGSYRFTPLGTAMATLAGEAASATRDESGTDDDTSVDPVGA